MREIERSTAFRRDYKREAEGRYVATRDLGLVPVHVTQVHDEPLAANHRDHDWAGYRDCHVEPDPVLIYQKAQENSLRLARLGSHSELFN